MKLPEIAERLRTLAALHTLPELETLADEIRRRPVLRRAPIKSTRMTTKLREDIRACVAANPDVPYARIAAAFNVNPGRVSEAMRGKRS
jgi:hypothetical protein